MTDLVTRLYALADTLNGALPMEPRQLAQAIIREAADALEQLKIRRDELMDSLNAHMEDNADLKAKLAEAEGTIKEWSLGWQLADSEWRVRAEKAEARVIEVEDELGKWHERAHGWGAERDEARAEAAALREAAHVAVKWVHQGDVSTVNAVARLSEALSQPGSGAAYQEEMTRLKATCEWQAESEKIAGIENLELSERMRKLEALHAAVIEEEAALDAYDNHEPGSIPRHVRSHSALKACLAALEEKK